MPARPGRRAARRPSTSSDPTTVEALVSDEWERRPDERTRAYEAFRWYRDAGAARTVTATAAAVGVTTRCAQGWSQRYDWRERAEAWDDKRFRVEDLERLEAIRTMHSNHQRAGRAAMAKALAALQALPVEHIPAGAAARLLELGARLERTTLTKSVEELQGVTVDGVVAEDPWDIIARELVG
jgi:hypothetical protein